ncbi:MAG: isoleucine--tRNA ligase [Nanoarchaeota archaeon]
MAKIDFKEIEEETLKFWKDKEIYKKSKQKNKNGKKFYMMDGPPYATGNIHMGTALNKILKDIAMRSHRLQGFDVFDRAGYDTHGVPIEFKVEKEIGTKSKQDIEKFGVKKFIEKCKKYATKYIDVMNSEFENLGVWMNFEDPYLTLSEEYVESIWETFKSAEEKELLYLGQYPVHICPRCETAVAFNEIEYNNQKDTSVYVKFPLKNKKNTYLIIWTTTPWTLPANTGVMIHPEFEYQEISLSNGEKWIIAKEIIPSLMAEIETGYTPEKIYKGKEMKDWEYENPLDKHMDLKLNKPRKVVLSGRYVNLEEGTGLVHVAPGHGKEDYEVGRENNLEILSPVSINGNLEKQTKKYSGKKARIVDKEIIEDLEKENFLVYKKQYEHDYPFCWRCDTPLLMIAQPQWFLKISKIQKKLLRENEKVNWNPKWMKLRMKAWLEGLSDWPVSRKRYWGTSLPIWVCDNCNKRKVIGSKKELENLSGKKVKEVHKPEIDKIKIKCSCGKEMSRVSDVLDVWFDSGVSSWAALKKGDKDNFEKFWPADLNIEGKDQVRGWWNSQFILSEIRFGKKPFVSIMEHGMILDLGKKKMSKSKGNAISPQDIFEKYGRDYLRYYFAKTSKGEDFAFDESEFSEIRRVFMVLINLNNFLNQLSSEKNKKSLEDKWILSKLNSTSQLVIDNYNEYRFPEAIRLLEDFIVNDFSRTYIKMIRDRSDEVYNVIKEIYLSLLKLLAPTCPLLTESIWQKLKKEKIVEEESIHLTKWPTPNKKLIDEKLENDFNIALQVIEKGLAERDRQQRGLKWPLPSATILGGNLKLNKELQEIIKNQLNVKELKIKSSENKQEISVSLDTNLTPELEAEGYAREMSRTIQAFRKKLGLEKTQFVNTTIITEDNFKNILEKNLNFLKQRTNSKKLEIRPIEKETFKNISEFKIKDKRGKIAIDIAE